MATEPQDPGVGRAADGHLRASDADRERVVDILKAAFVQGRLSNSELAKRAGQALVSRTYAELTAATTGIPPARASTPPTAPARAPAPARHVSRKAIAWALTMTILLPGLGVTFVTTYYGGFIIFLVLAFVAAVATGSPRSSATGRRDSVY